MGGSELAGGAPKVWEESESSHQNVEGAGPDPAQGGWRGTLWVGCAQRALTPGERECQPTPHPAGSPLLRRFGPGETPLLHSTELSTLAYGAWGGEGSWEQKEVLPAPRLAAETPPPSRAPSKVVHNTALPTSKPVHNTALPPPPLLNKRSHRGRIGRTRLLTQKEALCQLEKKGHLDSHPLLPLPA